LDEIAFDQYKLVIRKTQNYLILLLLDVKNNVETGRDSDLMRKISEILSDISLNLRLITTDSKFAITKIKFAELMIHYCFRLMES